MQRQEDLSRQEEQRQQQYQQQLQQQQYQQQEQQVQQFSQMAVESGTTVSEQRSFQQQQQESFQSSNSFQQTSSVRQQEVYEATERDGAMRGYQPKGVDETGRRSVMARDSGLFGGIGGDDNSLVDNEFDYKKHSVKDLAQHFALVKPKA